jgi:hypothetical protein
VKQLVFTFHSHGFTQAKKKKTLTGNHDLTRKSQSLGGGVPSAEWQLKTPEKELKMAVH